ncbi:acyltransferase family protein [Evansella tamaricis]|uniref:Acyltransferase family protein n=1 Tax=Evansella tamaricis TaxID=2069301 RepID=A0ABS6JHV7_9BACI|nr:acyltransferase family protein [Evansella tamaricis]MBU9712809.1 acyltransferase family protein [Evansella tamaricis]
MKKTMVNEVFILRSIACLAVVAVHAIAIGLSAIPAGYTSYTVERVLDSLNMLLYFGTPMFIFISEFLIAYSYNNKNLPSNFLKKRLKFLFLPFIIMGIFYSLPYILTSVEFWSTKVLMNIFIGDYHGYFILIIFQFYLLHVLFHQKLKEWNPKIVLSVSLLINVAYLAVFNFTSPGDILFGAYIWERFYWVPFLGWLFYFTLGFYCGHYYHNFVALIKKYRKAVLFSPLVSSLILLFLYHLEWITVHSSKRMDMILHMTVICFFLFYIATQLKKVPDFLVGISRYSFGIYLLHYFFILAIDFVYQQYPVNMGVWYIVVLFAASIALSVASTSILNKWKYGKYIVGKVGIGTEGKLGKERKESRQDYSKELSEKRYATYSS